MTSVPLLAAQQPSDPSKQAGVLDQEFKAAVSAYDAGKYSQAEARLQDLASRVPTSFEVHELLGLAYAAQSKSVEALGELKIAVRIEPKSATARSNLATALIQSGDLQQAEIECREALDLSPQSYNTNHNLAVLYLRESKVDDALPLLEAAQRIHPAAYDNGYDLALAYLLVGRLKDSRQLTSTLVSQKNSGELHMLLGRVNEKEGHFLEAADEFAVAARMDPSEDNLFAWASELLLHRAYEAAIEVFKIAAQRYPKSPRLWTGLGMSLYSRAEYDEAVRSLVTAADLNPTDPRCYLFLSKAFLSSPNQAQDVIGRFQRYTEIEPNNALAQFYYAVALWKGHRVEGPQTDYRAIESILQRSIALDEKRAETHLQLGILYNDNHAYEKALPEYERALELNPSLSDAHYRLGRLYLRNGEKVKAEHEFDLLKTFQAQHQAEIDKESADVQQFVIATKVSSPVEK